MSSTDNASDKISHQAMNPSDPELDAALGALQAVVLAQKAQIDSLLASLEGLLGVLNHPSLPLHELLTKPQQTHLAAHLPLQEIRQPERILEAPLLGNPKDPQFANLHQLMQRLRSG